MALLPLIKTIRRIGVVDLPVMLVFIGLDWPLFNRRIWQAVPAQMSARG